MASSDSKQQAENLVREIRALRRVDDPEDENSKDLERALKLISDELYSTPTHFVLELVQNADDNKYAPGVTAKLVFLYRDDGFLWIACNERGFEAEHVRSICRFHQSTKSVEESEKGLIGEKGIGFKSVFKVADTVWISSGPFHFRFDRDARLGMIAPVWDEQIPSNNLIKETTIFCMKIPDPDDRALVVQHLHAIEPELPLFLRNIRTIQVIFQQLNKHVSENYSITRVRSNETSHDIKLVKRNHKNETEETLLRLVSTTCITVSMPYEKRREGVKHTFLEINFPLNVDGHPQLQNRPLYNFLPVRAYGLPFILNADFLLSANREDVEHGKSWNHALLKYTIELFSMGVSRFNKENIAKYSWPRFTRSLASNNGTVFESLLPDIVNHLRTMPVLESQAGTLQAPQTLAYVPELFTDGGTPPVPLLATAATLHQYLATPYSYHDVWSLGVTEITAAAFLEGLRSYIFNSSTAFKSRPPDWHARVARALRCKYSSAKKLKNIPFIPLRNGTWISWNGGDFYFPSSTGGLQVPGGIDVPVIAQDAVNDSDRLDFYRWLGAKELTPREICSRVMKEHAIHPKAYGKWTRNIVIEHAWYLFLVSRNLVIDKPRDLWLAVEDMPSLQKAGSLYLAIDNEFSIAKFVPKGVVQYVDPAYHTYGPDHLSGEWIAWMRDTLGVNTIPKLVGGTTMTPEFSHIIQKTPSQSFLRLMVANWDIYANLGFYSISVRETIASSIVDCRVGSKSARYPLQDTFLPAPTLLNAPFAKDILPFVLLDDQNSPQWFKLSHFGVCTTLNVKFFLGLLTGLSENASLRPTKEEIMRIYEQIQARYHENPDLVKRTFQKSVIFIASPIPIRWVKLNECVWQAPSQLQILTALSRRYPTLEALFKKYLGLKNASTADLVNQLVKYSGQISQMENIKSLLVVLNTCLVNGFDHDSIDRLKSAAVFPVRQSQTEVKLCTIVTDGWCVADRDGLKACFTGKVGLLDFLVKDLRAGGRMEPLLKRLKLLEHRLSTRVKETTETAGSVDLEEELIDMFHSRAKFIARLVPKEKRPSAMKQLMNIQVFAADNLTLRRSISIANNTINADASGHVCMSTDSSGRACMYLKAEAIESADLPFYYMGQELHAYFDIPHSFSNLVQAILTTKDDGQVVDMLDRENIEEDANLDEQSEEGMDYTGPQEPDSPEQGQPEAHDKSASASGQKAQSRGKASGASSKVRRKQHGFQTFGSSKPGPSFSMDATKIVAAAKNFRSNQIVRFNSAVGGRSSNTSGDQLSSGMSDPARRSERGAWTPSRRAAHISSGAGDARITSVPQEPERSEYQQDVGAAGEYFVYNLFKALFDIDDGMWTSNIRTQYGFPVMDSHESDYADFTIDEPNAVGKFTDWLIDGGHPEAADWKAKGITYHVEVKTTTGGCRDAFSMSNNQVDLARQWYESETHVCILLRVFHFSSKPEVQYFVDPYGLHMEGLLKFQAQGFWVQPA
ncbi:hypothetical protein EV356DRAFT_487514 [Viridothelium virens]|uniref:Protein NO VEIN C-terminal domain-containing protein n=1 Tax=Viridothelium virens TaxID=1048519 RepID=A0A6A6H532_VIRVR|nr:hypothetical protein EV356DRAFT_487514 [Viridothelium virens]